MVSMSGEKGSKVSGSSRREMAILTAPPASSIARGQPVFCGLDSEGRADEGRELLQRTRIFANGYRALPQIATQAAFNYHGWVSPVPDRLLESDGVMNSGIADDLGP
jgi:hypothetical protein